MDRQLRGNLVEGAARFGVEVDERLAAVLGRYLATLERWNRKINLTSIRDPRGVVDKHFLDSLAVVPHMPRDVGSLVDVGSGAGFPGAVIALACPWLAVTLVEANNRKAAFLQTLKRELPIPNVTVVAGRMEELAATFDVAVSRATWAIPEWLSIARGLVVSGGVIIGMEGSEAHVLPSGCLRFPYVVAGSRRAIIRCRRE